MKQRFEYHVMGAMTIDGLATEIAKRAREGFRVVAALPDLKGRNRLVLILERPIEEPS
jgi:hypothetical protein